MMKDFSKESFDILIQAGQSNSVGCGYGATDEPYVTNENIWYMHSNFTISLAGEFVSANEVVGNYWVCKEELELVKIAEDKIKR